MKSLVRVRCVLEGDVDEGGIESLRGSLPRSDFPEEQSTANCGRHAIQSMIKVVLRCHVYV